MSVTNLSAGVHSVTVTDTSGGFESSGDYSLLAEGAGCERAVPLTWPALATLGLALLAIGYARMRVAPHRG